MKIVLKKTIIASCIGIAMTPYIVLSAQLPSVTTGQTTTATENTIYDQQVGPSGIIYVNGGTLNIENNVTIDSTNSSVTDTGNGILILGNGSTINGTDNLTINVNKSQSALSFNQNSSNATISLGNNINVTATEGIAVLVRGTNNTLTVGENSNLSSNYVALSVSGDNANVNIGKNANLSSTNSSAVVVGGNNAKVSIDDGAIINASGYGLILNGKNNVVNLGKVQMTGSRAILMSGNDNTVVIASGSVLTGVSSLSDPDGSVLAIGGIGNTITADDTTLVGNSNQIIRFSASGANAQNDGNVINLNNSTIVNNYDAPGFAQNDSVIGILTTNNNQFESEYQFTLNLNGGLISTTNSNLINSDMQQHQNSDEVSTAKALVNITDTVMDNENSYYLVSFGSSDLSHNATDLTLNLTRTDATNFSRGIINNDQSTLTLNLDASQIMGDIVNTSDSQGKMQINADNGSVISGNVYALNNEDDVDTENAYTSIVLNNASWIHEQNSHVVDLTNGGNIVFNSPDSGHTLTVHGDYIGNNGHILFNSQLEGDDSITDKLIVKGNTSGTTSVSVNNIGGQGAQTINGIELIKVGGDSAGNFEQNGRIVAGAYEYFLVRGQGDNSTNWYLTNQSNDSTDPQGPAILRPEAGSYLANMAAANGLFNLRLEDREGRAENSSLWLRQVGSHTRSRDSTGQLNNQTNRYVVQGGGEIYDTQFMTKDRLGLGVMVGYGKASTNTKSLSNKSSSKGEVDGYNAGLYATWYQNANTLNGTYIDSWINYSWLDASVNGQELNRESYKINGYSASIETGYRQPVYKGLNGNVFVTPQAQVIWNGLQADKHTESNGTQVKSGGSDNLQTRLGFKVSRDGVSDIDKGKDKLFTVYTEANWIYNSKSANATLDGEMVNQAGNRNIGELKLGTEGQLNRSLDLWTNVAQQLGNAGYRDTSVNLGIKVGF